MTKTLEAQHLILAVIVTIISTVLALEFYGYIQHSDHEDSLLTGTYRSVIIETGQEYRMSAKPSDKRSYCVQGYLALQFADSGKSAGFLIDEKNSGIPCGQ